jgi:hypothetical protein
MGRAPVSGSIPCGGGTSTLVRCSHTSPSADHQTVVSADSETNAVATQSPSTGATSSEPSGGMSDCAASIQVRPSLEAKTMVVIVRASPFRSP